MNDPVMVLWLRRDLVTIPPDLLTIEKAMVLARVASSLSEARRLIDQGAAYLNNEKIVPPGPVREWAGLLIGNGEILKERYEEEIAGDSLPGLQGRDDPG